MRYETALLIRGVSLDDRIKKPKTNRYPSLKGVDPKFRRNHRHALHGTMKTLVRFSFPSHLQSQGFSINRSDETLQY